MLIQFSMATSPSRYVVQDGCTADPFLLGCFKSLPYSPAEIWDCIQASTAKCLSSPGGNCQHTPHGLQLHLQRHARAVLARAAGLMVQTRNPVLFANSAQTAPGQHLQASTDQHGPARSLAACCSHICPIPVVGICCVLDSEHAAPALTPAQG